MARLNEKAQPSGTKQLMSQRIDEAMIEGGLLLIAAPFLLFPTLSVVGTTLALTLLGLLWLRQLLPKRRPAVPVTPFNLALVLLTLMLIVAIIVTADPDLALPKATGFILGLFVWSYMARVIKGRQDLHRSVIVFILLGMGFVLLGALSVDWSLKVPFLTETVANLPSGIIRLPETSNGGVHPNQLAGTLLLFLPFTVSVLLGWQRERYTYIFLFITCMLGLLILFVVLLSQSRSAWLGGLGGGLALLLLWGSLLPPSRKRKAIRWTTGLAAAAGVSLLLLIGPARLQEFWTDPGQYTAVGPLDTLSFRQEVWRWALVAVDDFPFTGTGLGSFRRVVRRLYPLAATPDYDIGHAHNIFLQVVLDVGLPGLVVYISILMIAAVIGWQVARQDEQLRPFALGLLAGLFALHVYGLTDALALGSKTGLAFWMILGMLVGMRRIVDRQRKEFAK
jgi:putative inorganic carbon (HCO3(-)) transporter